MTLYRSIFPEENTMGASFNGSSWILYQPRHKPSPTLSLYVTFMPRKEDGTIMRMFRKCNSENCVHELNIVLEHKKLRFTLEHQGHKLEVNTTETLEVGAVFYSTKLIFVAFK